MANWVTTDIVWNDRLIVEIILSFVGGETVNCAWVNSNLGTYCKGAVHKKSDKILAGSLKSLKQWARSEQEATGKSYTKMHHLFGIAL